MAYIFVVSNGYFLNLDNLKLHLQGSRKVKFKIKINYNSFTDWVYTKKDAIYLLQPVIYAKAG